MWFEDYRTFLETVDDAGELKIVRGADTRSDIGPITEMTAWSPEHPLIVFDDIPGYRPGWRVAVHSFDSYLRTRLIYGFPDGLRGRALVAWWKARLDDYRPVPPNMVDSGPVTEVVRTGDDVDLDEFPAPLWHAADGGPYLATGGASVLRDPDTGDLNVGCYRGMRYDRTTIGHHLAGGHNGQVIRDKYFERGLNCPVVISLGNDPAFTLAGAENVGYGTSELEFGGFLRGAPFDLITGPVTGLPFPATAEAVLEGEILHPDIEPKRMEGPWGEGAGYYASAFAQPPVRVKAVYRRAEPIVMGEPTLRFRKRGAAGSFARGARQEHMLERSGLGGIRGVGHVGPFLVISVKQQYSGHALRVADFAMAGMADRPPRYLVMVDDDIDPDDAALVNWAISTRVDPAAQVHLNRDRWCNVINPAGLTPAKRAIEDYTIGTMIIDACKPYRWRGDWDKMFRTSDIEEDLRARTAKRWESTLGSLITAPKPI
jgi:4-hydroxy-3-polyprenylbenzoate decarboxylase